NPSLFYNPFQFEITFECIEDLKNDLEWKIIYVGSAESEEYDQVLDTVFVGPVPEGRHMFVFQANAPDPSKIPVADAVGVTVVLLTCSYLNKEFVRVGYYVNNEYTDPELRENPPSIPQFDKLQRNILATDPRITKFKIDWGEEEDSSINSSNISEAFPNASNIDNLEFKQNGNGSLDNSNCFISEDSIGPLNPVTIIDNSRSMEI
ncbi:histone chaperone asf1-like protein, partial [Sarcoptes scabiei]